MSLVLGMCVQSRGQRRYAFCLRCWWASPVTTFTEALKIASTPDSHDCLHPKTWR